MRPPRRSPRLWPWVLGLSLLALAVWALGEYVAVRSASHSPLDPVLRTARTTSEMVGNG